jgi:cold shock CspA family protein
MADGSVRRISVTKHVGFVSPHDGFRDVFVRFSSVEGFSNQEQVLGTRGAKTETNGSRTTRMPPR